MSEHESSHSETCERCGKRPATVRIRKVASGEEEEHRVCISCAREMGVEPETPAPGAVMNDPLAILFKSIEETEDSGAICPGCGLTFRRFRETARVGCATCYETFEEEMTLLLRRIHGSTVHRGRVPVADAQLQDGEAVIRRLSQELERAVVTEDYERAAQLRDRLRELGAPSARQEEETS